MRRWWLRFAQAVTVGLAVAALVIALLPADWFASPPGVVTVKEAPALPAEAKPAAAPATLSFQGAARTAMPSVVNIYTAKLVRSPLLDDPVLRRFFGEAAPAPERVTSLGSGVIASPEGYVLTNNHVVEAADEIAVVLPGARTVAARVVGTDPETDLAVLKIAAPDLAPIAFADSDRLQVGDAVLAIGNPFGVGQTVTFGIVSATGRTGLGINTFENFIQTDAAINPGNSGGALVDTAGRLIGINTAIFSETGGSLGIGFAIPANLARQVMEQIVTRGGVVRGWLGIDVADLTPALAARLGLKDTAGVLAAGVQRGGPAERAGLRPGDVLLRFEGEPLSSAADALNRIAALAPGRTATLTVRRDGKEFPLEITVGKRPRLRAPTPGE
ncbi:trypsin-like peptidase domain-containing protein [Sulfurifustis variabilis]|uniref:S1C family serine protease n=1 Tax=Sulfurifustis variabilis TaxID=1675686 RepID=UPI000BBB3A21